MYNALVSIFNKNNVKKIVEKLLEKGLTIYASKGTYDTILSTCGTEIKKKVICLSELTGFEQYLGGRIKTLHPAVFSGVLANTKDDFAFLKDKNLPFFNLVVVEVYPFDRYTDLTDNEVVEFIDIGGISLLRAAAKNFRHVSVVMHPEDIDEGIKALESLELRKKLAARIFDFVANYDQLIAQRLSEYEKKVIYLEKVEKVLRYGENPHQKAVAYKLKERDSLFDFPVYTNKEMSYNNYLDLDALLRILLDLKQFRDKSACAIIKHNNPCGVAVGKSSLEAYKKALSTDPVSAFGGVMGFTKKICMDTAEEIGDRFFDIIAAPSFDDDALKFLRSKKNRRIVELTNFQELQEEEYEYRYVRNGFLYQDTDRKIEMPEEFKCVAGNGEYVKKRYEDLFFAWALVKRAKSNAIVLVKELQTIGIGEGQVSRIGAVKLALTKALENKLSPAQTVCASDAFLPFTDSIEELAKHGVKCVVQPGGSIKDNEIIKRAEELGIEMYFTNVRHFRH